MSVTRYQKAGQKHSIKTENRSFEDVTKFKYLGTTLMDQNSKLHAKRDEEQTKFGECLLLVSSESSVFPYAL
jgi:hypothetical protein